MKYINKILKKKRNKKQTGRIALILVLVLGIMPITESYASKIEDANNVKNDAQNALDATREEMERIEAEQAELMEEIEALDEELVNVIMELSILESDIAAAEANLKVIQADLAQAKIDEEEQYQAMKKRIRFMYERGDTAFLVSILESKSITDLLNRVEYVNEVYDYDRQLLVTYQTTKLQVAELEVQVLSEIASMEDLKLSFEEEQSRYETMIAERESQIANFDSQLASAEELAGKYMATIEEQNEIIRKEEERIRREEEEKKNQANGGGSNTGSATGNAIVEYACQFIGNKYVYGGTDINNGIDCSAFVRYVYAHFGYSLPRTSYQQRKVGREVSYAEAQPGDIICYSGHVAIYMGDGKIVHASNSAPYPAGGIKISNNAAYRTIITVRRVVN